MLISVCSSRDSEFILIGKHSHRQERQSRKELVDHLSPRFRKTVRSGVGLSQLQAHTQRHPCSCMTPPPRGSITFPNRATS